MEVHQHKPAVDQVVVGRLILVQGDIALAHLDVGLAHITEVSGIDVGGYHIPRGSHTIREPAGHRTGARANLEAAPSDADADGVEDTVGMRIAFRLQQPQPRELIVRVGIRGEVVAAYRHGLLATWRRDQRIPLSLSVRRLLPGDAQRLRACCPRDLASSLLDKATELLQQ